VFPVVKVILGVAMTLFAHTEQLFPDAIESFGHQDGAGSHDLFLEPISKLRVIADGL
jgi:hypothetical protein